MHFIQKDEIKWLSAQLKNGDESAFTKLYKLYAAKLYANLFYFIKDEEIAKELLQDIFLKVWNQKENIDPEKSFKAFIYKIGHNLIYDHFRKAALDRKLTNAFISKFVEEYTHVEEQLLNKEVSQILKQAIDCLPTQRKMVFTLCKLEGKSYKEVSEIMNISVSTISDHIVKATKSVKEYILLNDSVALSAAITSYIIFFG